MPRVCPLLYHNAHTVAKRTHIEGLSQGIFFWPPRHPPQVVRRLMRDERADPFLVPVDAEALGVPEYREIIKHPIDLGTIRRRLESGGFYSSYDAIRADILRCFDNCLEFNEEDSTIAEWARGLKVMAINLLTSEMAEVNSKVDDRGAKRSAAKMPEGEDDMKKHRLAEDFTDATGPLSTRFRAFATSQIVNAKISQIVRTYGESAHYLVDSYKGETPKTFSASDRLKLNVAIRSLSVQRLGGVVSLLVTRGVVDVTTRDDFIDLDLTDLDDDCVREIHIYVDCVRGLM